MKFACWIVYHSFNHNDKYHNHDPRCQWQCSRAVSATSWQASPLRGIGSPSEPPINLQLWTIYLQLLWTIYLQLWALSNIFTTQSSLKPNRHCSNQHHKYLNFDRHWSWFWLQYHILSFWWYKKLMKHWWRLCRVCCDLPEAGDFGEWCDECKYWLAQTAVHHLPIVAYLPSYHLTNEWCDKCKYGLTHTTTTSIFHLCQRILKIICLDP